MTSPTVPQPLDVRRRTVVYVGNFRFPWCTEVHATAALESLGCTVVRAQEGAPSGSGLKWPELAPMVEACGAELVIWQRTHPQPLDEVLAALNDLRRAGVPTVSYHLDRWLGLEREPELVGGPFFRTDLVVSPDGTPTDRWAELDIRHRWMPPGVAAEELDIGTRSRKWEHLDAVFVGSYPYPHREWARQRAAVVEAFAKAFGKRFAVLPGAGRPAIRNKALADVYATVPVILGDSCLAGAPELYWSDRIPETIGRGGLLIHPATPGLEDWYQHGKHLMAYWGEDPSVAVHWAKVALDQPEEAAAIRAAGRELVRSRDTYAHRMAEILSVVDEPGFKVRDPERRRRSVDVVFGPSTRYRARFLIDDRDGVAQGLAEVWQANDYRLEPGQVAGGIVVDVGANVGAFSVLAAMMGAARVEAYEPDPTNYALLLENTRQAEGIVTCWPVAVMPVGVEAVIVSHEGGGAWVEPAPSPAEAQALIAAGELSGFDRIAAADTLATVIMRACPADEVTPPLSAEELKAREDWATARAESLAGWAIVRREALDADAPDPGEWPDPGPWVDPRFAERTVVLGQIDLLKVDIEGGEYGAFRDLDRRLLRRVRRIVLEFHGPAMPHLRHLEWPLPHECRGFEVSADPLHGGRWGRLVALLASEGRLETLGRPDVGGLLWWDRYDDPEPRWREEA